MVKMGYVGRDLDQVGGKRHWVRHFESETDVLMVYWQIRRGMYVQYLRLIYGHGILGFHTRIFPAGSANASGISPFDNLGMVASQALRTCGRRIMLHICQDLRHALLTATQVVSVYQ
jgi:hypothetical protein